MKTHPIADTTIPQTPARIWRSSHSPAFVWRLMPKARTTAICLAVLPLALLAQTPSFTGIGDLPGGATNSGAFAISADGTTVVGGGTTAAGVEAYYWREGLLVSIGDLPGGEVLGYAVSANSNGSIIVGRGRTASGDEAFRWEGGTLVGLGTLPGYNQSHPRGISRDGMVIAGSVTQGPQGSYSAIQAFRWQGGTMAGLGDLPGGGVNSAVGSGSPVNTNGTIIVGRGATGISQYYEAFLWQNGTLSGLGYLAGAPYRYSQANGVSGNGRFVVGQAASPRTPQVFDIGEACIWRDGVLSGLGDFAGGDFSSAAFAVSDDGQVVIGYGTTATGLEAFIWDPVNGMRALRSVLTDSLGLDLTGWTLAIARGISADGTAVVGDGVHNGNSEGWIARFSRHQLLYGTNLVASIKISCVDVCWPSADGQRYQVEYRSTLTGGQWLPLGSPVTGTGSEMCVTDSIRASEQRYYRVVELP